MFICSVFIRTRHMALSFSLLKILWGKMILAMLFPFLLKFMLKIRAEKMNALSKWWFLTVYCVALTFWIHSLMKWAYYSQDIFFLLLHSLLKGSTPGFIKRENRQYVQKIWEQKTIKQKSREEERCQRGGYCLQRCCNSEGQNAATLSKRTRATSQDE